jgi:hypothetical protein
MLLGLVVAGCGNERRTPPDLNQLAEPDGYAVFRSRSGEVSYRYPESWITLAGQAPQVARTGSGGALVAIYAYPRDDLDPTAFEANRERLVDSLIERAPGFEITGTEQIEVDGAPAIEVDGRGRVGDEQVRTRAIHVYEDGVEYVIDAYARPELFGEANRVAFAPLLSSLELDPSVRTDEG